MSTLCMLSCFLLKSLPYPFLSDIVYLHWIHFLGSFFEASPASCRGHNPCWRGVGQWRAGRRTGAGREHGSSIHRCGRTGYRRSGSGVLRRRFPLERRDIFKIDENPWKIHGLDASSPVCKDWIGEGAGGYATVWSLEPGRFRHVVT